jgi:hypothetical protein
VSAAVWSRDASACVFFHRSCLSQSEQVKTFRLLVWFEHLCLCDLCFCFYICILRYFTEWHSKCSVCTAFTTWGFTDLHTCTAIITSALIYWKFFTSLDIFIQLRHPNAFCRIVFFSRRHALVMLRSSLCWHCLSAWLWTYLNPEHVNLMPLLYDVNYNAKPGLRIGRCWSSTDFKFNIHFIVANLIASHRLDSFFDVLFNCYLWALVTLCGLSLMSSILLHVEGNPGLVACCCS